MKMLLCSIGSKKRKTTLRYGATLAKALSAEVMLLGVVDKKRKINRLAAIMDTIARELTDEGLTVEMRIEVGNAEEALLTECKRETYDLIAMGALGGKRARRTLVSSVARRLLDRTESSVLVIKGDRTEISRVLVCSSGTEHGRLAVWTGATIACLVGAQATLLHVLDPMPAMYAGLERMEETLSEFLASDTEPAHELKWGAQVIKAECGIAQLKIRRGIVADEILREGERGDYDLIVLGSSRYPTGLVRIAMSNVAHEVVSRARRPVLVVRPHD